MTPDNANNERSALLSQIRFHKLMSLILAVIIFGGMIIFGYVLVRDTTKILPPEIRRPYEIGANYANKEYLLDMANYVLGTVLNVTPENADHNNKVILKMAHPDGYPTLKTALDAAAMRIRQEKVTTIWVPRKEEVFERDKRVKVNGKLKTYIADKLTSEREKNYIVEFTITTSGRLYVSKIEEIIKKDSGTNNSD